MSAQAELIATAILCLSLSTFADALFMAGQDIPAYDASATRGTLLTEYHDNHPEGQECTY